jgi:Bacterial membrane protein YfhO
VVQGRAVSMMTEVQQLAKGRADVPETRAADRASLLGRGAAPWATVAVAISWNLWELRATLLRAQFVNDSSVHEQMVRFAAARIAAGHDPLTSWFPYLGLGSPQFVHYQSAPAILTGLAGLVTGPDVAFRWSLYLLWCLWPIAIYGSARVLGLDRGAAAAAAVVAPLLRSVQGIGYEQHAYVWAGFGVWTQLWASWTLPFAWALTWRALADKRFIAPAAGLIALTAAFHYETGYLAFGGVLVMAPLVRRDLAPRLARGVILLGVALAASAWVVVPLIAFSRWAAINQALAAGPSASGFGARTTLGWLITGKVFDYGHLPVISLLVAAGVVVTVLRWRTAGPERALAVLLAGCLALSFGRTTYGELASVIPGQADVFFRRFLMGSQLAGIYLAGVGVAAIAAECKLLARRFTRLRPARSAWVPVVLAAVLGAGYLYPAWGSLASFDTSNAYLAQVQEQAQVSPAQVRALDAMATVIARHGPGRVYAGTPANWRQYPTVGLLPMYEFLASLDIDEVGHTLRTASLMSQPEYRFDPADPGGYALLGIRYVILPTVRVALAAPPKPPPGAVLILRNQLLRVYELPADSYIRIADTVGSLAEDRADIGSQSAAYLNSALPGQGKYRTVGYAGARPAPPTLQRGTAAARSPGSVLGERAELNDGTATATVHLRRRAAVVLSASYDPGWSATIDGRPASIEMIAPALVGVTVPAGTHRIVFRYTGYSGYPWLFGLAVLALLLTAALSRRDRKEGSIASK